MGLHVGLYDHLGWAIAVTASGDLEVVDRRRMELLEPGVPSMPIHHPGQGLSLDEVEALVARVRASAKRATATSLDALAAALPGPITSMHLRRRKWPEISPISRPDPIARTARRRHIKELSRATFQREIARTERELSRISALGPRGFWGRLGERSGPCQ